MGLLRRLILNHRRLAGVMLVLALGLKLLVPGGFMPSAAGGQIVASICTGSGAPRTVLAQPRSDHGGAHEDGRHGKVEQPCAFSGLAVPSLMPVDPVLLALAVLFVMALAVRSTPGPVSRVMAWLRPPLRAPPASL